MSGDWIKMRSNLWDDPRIGHIADLTGASEGPVIGALYWLWATADQHSEDGFMPSMSLRQIDRKTALPGFASALIEIGWLIEENDGVTIVKFEEHNGSSAKRRCTDAQRKANSRNVSASDADKERTPGGRDEDEKRRSAELEIEKEKEKNSSSLRSEEKPPRKRRGKSADADLLVSAEDLVQQGVGEQHARDWLAIRAKKALPLTRTALDGVVAQAAEAGMTLPDAIRTAAENSWGGFRASWLQEQGRGGASARGSPPAETAYQRATRERVSEMTGGLAAAPAPGTVVRSPFEVFDAAPAAPIAIAG